MNSIAWESDARNLINHVSFEIKSKNIFDINYPPPLVSGFVNYSSRGVTTNVWVEGAAWDNRTTKRGLPAVRRLFHLSESWIK